jgi:hypothetical protein
MEVEIGVVAGYEAEGHGWEERDWVISRAVMVTCGNGSGEEVGNGWILDTV